MVDVVVMLISFELLLLIKKRASALRRCGIFLYFLNKMSELLVFFTSFEKHKFSLFFIPFYSIVGIILSFVFHIYLAYFLLFNVFFVLDKKNLTNHE